MSDAQCNPSRRPHLTRRQVESVSATHFTVGGIPVARAGDKCSCPIKGHDNCTIAEGDPHHLIDVIAVAYDGHKTTCGATLIPTIYGADSKRQSFSEVTWEISNCTAPIDWQNWPILEDSKQGRLRLVDWDPGAVNNIASLLSEDVTPSPVFARILPASAPGDQTVPAKSADHQLHSGRFKGIFRQTGYEHQSSYKDPRAVGATLYSIVRIAQTATWKNEKE